MHTQTANPRIDISFADKLYKSSDSINPVTVRDKILNKKKQLRIHLIAESEADGELFVIYKADELFLPIYDNTAVKVVGIGKGRKTTLKLLGEILTDMKLDKADNNDNSFANS